MDSKKEHQKELFIMWLKFGTPIIVGIIILVTSSLLKLSDAFPDTPLLVFKILNGCSILLILIFGVIWSQAEKNMQKEQKK